jgi:hypothetical protein
VSEKEGVKTSGKARAMAHAYNPSYSGGKYQEYCVLKPARQIDHETLSQKYLQVAQGIGPEIKPQAPVSH